MKVLHILYQSLPQISGSSIRSRDTLMSQKEIGIDVFAISSPFQSSVSGEKEDIIDGIRYVRTSKTKNETISDIRKRLIVRLRRLFTIITFTSKLYYVVKHEKPDILHAHAMFFCALPALIIGRFFKIPVVYEFRSLWMYEKSKSKSPKRINKIIENILLKIEMLLLRKVDKAIVININLKEFLQKKSKRTFPITIIKNAVNTFLIEKAKQKLVYKKRELVYGYIGTITSYEGIEFLVKSFQSLYDEGFERKLLIYGKGMNISNVLAIINERPDIKNITYEGVISPQKVHHAFEKIDVIINPRLSTPLTNSVTPLKPLEAMAYEKLFIGSDVKGIKEVVSSMNGFLFKSNDMDELKDVVKSLDLLSDTERRNYIENSLKYVKTNRSWTSNAKEYYNIYKNLITKV